MSTDNEALSLLPEREVDDVFDEHAHNLNDFRGRRLSRVEFREAARAIERKARAALAQRQHVMDSRIEAAFREGYFSRETYNDKDVTDVDAQWEKARASLTVAPPAQHPEPATPQRAVEPPAKMVNYFIGALTALCNKARPSAHEFVPGLMQEIVKTAEKLAARCIGGPDPHREHWVAIAKASEAISASTNYGPEQAAEFCRALDGLSVALMREEDK